MESADYLSTKTFGENITVCVWSVLRLLTTISNHYVCQCTQWSEFIKKWEMVSYWNITVDMQEVFIVKKKTIFDTFHQKRYKHPFKEKCITYEDKLSTCCICIPHKHQTRNSDLGCWLSLRFSINYCFLLKVKY